MTQKTFTFTEERISAENRDNGRQIMKVTPGGTKILAYILNGEITQYEAEDATGGRRTLFSVSQILPSGGHLVDTGGDFCWVCVDDADFGIFCYQVECPPVPPPDQVLGP